MVRQTSWGAIDFEAEGAIDPEWMFAFGSIRGKGVKMEELRATVVAAQRRMKAAYDGAYEQVAVAVTLSGDITVVEPFIQPSS